MPLILTTFVSLLEYSAKLLWSKRVLWMRSSTSCMTSFQMMMRKMDNRVFQMKKRVKIHPKTILREVVMTAQSIKVSNHPHRKHRCSKDNNSKSNWQPCFSLSSSFFPSFRVMKDVRKCW